MGNLVIGVGNTGTNIVKLAAMSTLLDDTNYYAIDSVASSIDMDSIGKIKYIPIISDEKTGSGRDRERGRAMYEFHQNNGEFEEMYEEAAEAKSPVIVITSAAGGTGSGSVVPLCSKLIEKGISVIPIIICPNKKDPAAFHLNTSDLFIELDEIGITTYAVFENKKGDANYGPINQEVVTMIELLFGKKFDKTELDSIDDSDLDKLIEMPGRIMAVEAEGATVDSLRKEITRKLFVGSQPMWKSEEVGEATLMTAFSLKSMFADVDFKSVFSEIDARIDPDQVFDNYRNIVKNDNDGILTASVIITGLPRSEIKEILNDYQGTKGIGDGVKRAKRPSFMSHKKATIETVTAEDGKDVINRFKWKK